MTKRERIWWRRRKQQKIQSQRYRPEVSGWDVEDFLDFPEDDDDDSDQGWLCGCGHWQDNGFHCSYCGGEPPWGCDCSSCNEKSWNEVEHMEFDGWNDLYDAPIIPPTTRDTNNIDDLPF